MQEESGCDTLQVRTCPPCALHMPVVPVELIAGIVCRRGHSVSHTDHDCVVHAGDFCPACGQPIALATQQAAARLVVAGPAALGFELDKLEECPERGLQVVDKMAVD